MKTRIKDLLVTWNNKIHNIPELLSFVLFILTAALIIIMTASLIYLIIHILVAFLSMFEFAAGAVLC